MIVVAQEFVPTLFARATMGIARSLPLWLVVPAASKTPSTVTRYTRYKRRDESRRGRQECPRHVAGARVFMDSCGPAGPMGAGRSACATPRRESLA